MPYYPDEIVNDIFAENDIVDYVSKYVNLKKTGRDYSGLCPFHREKSPSFHVSSEKQLFHCFGCGASGNLVQFVMRTEGLDFVEAIKLLADRAGIQLPEDNGQNNIESGSLKKKIYEMNKLAARFFYENLTKHPEGKTALAYFQERKISKKTIISYGLGFARDNYTALHDYLLTQGYTKDEMLSAGLVVLREDKLYDKFRNRVMFPIIDLRGNIIGFGGRIMGDATTPNGFKLPKYLNTAETPVFNKGKNLFSLNLAKKSSPVSIVLVEGYMDVISVFQSGITNVVATLGTALTENQAKLLMKYCNEILICYDSDEAGQKATIRAIEIINSVGGRSKV
ncbi:MAG: DNA primase, partial [Clostridia bacterium]|nr:DNA primase [Clostridia bacterium]